MVGPIQMNEVEIQGMLKFEIGQFDRSLDELVMNETKPEITSSNFGKEGHDNG